MEILSQWKMVLRMVSINIIWFHNCLIWDILIIFLLIRKGGRKLGSLIRSLRPRIKGSFCRSWKLRSPRRNNSRNRKGRNKMLRCICLMGLVRRLWELMIFKKYRKWEGLKNKCKNLLLKLRSWSKHCKRELNNKIKRNCKLLGYICIYF